MHLTFTYNVLSQRTNIARYQSTGTTNVVATTDYTYDTGNRLASITHKQGGTTLAGYTYGFDNASRLTSVNSTIEGLSTYSYDATSQVTAADHNSQTDETYSYDLNGNRNSSGYTTTTNNRTTAGGGFTYVYDDEGNRTSRTETATGKVQEYSWDHRNRLITVKERNSAGGAIVKQVDYVYDAFNRLVKRTYDADGAGAGAATNQYWAYDEGINALVQFDGNAASNLSHRYLWSDMVDEILADEVVTSLGSGGNVQWPLGDHLGTVRDIADLNEGTGVTSVTNHRTYNAYGKLVAETNAAVDLIFGFTGKQLDDATGLQHNLFRWYDANFGQWLSEDPLGFAAGDENVRRYCQNSSIVLVDPIGLSPPPMGNYYSDMNADMQFKRELLYDPPSSIESFRGDLESPWHFNLPDFSELIPSYVPPPPPPQFDFSPPIYDVPIQLPPSSKRWNNPLEYELHIPLPGDRWDDWKFEFVPKSLKEFKIELEIS